MEATGPEERQGLPCSLHPALSNCRSHAAPDGAREGFVGIGRTIDMALLRSLRPSALFIPLKTARNPKRAQQDKTELIPRTGLVPFPYDQSGHRTR